MPAEVANWVGRVIDGRYVVDSVIGQGGMGIVLRARHKFTGAQVAVKMLNPELQVNAEVHERFLAEARTPSTIGHPGIVQVLDAGTTPEGELYFAMELLTGRTLRQAMYPSLPPQVARRITLELLDALGAAHARGIIHRDLKPENVFLAGPTGTVKLLDFGIAKVIQTARTHQGAMLGTLSYMSPEQLMDASTVDARADLWAVGVMIYEMLSGQLPYKATTLVDVIQAFNTRDADPIRYHVPPTTLWLDKAEALFSRALARDRRHRFSSTQELAAALSSVGLEDSQLTTAGSTLTGVMASRGSNVMTAADSGPQLPRTGSGLIARPRGRPSAPDVVPSGSQHVAPPARNVRASQAPAGDPFPPANPAFSHAPTFVPDAPPHDGVSMPAVSTHASGSPSAPFAVPVPASPSMPLAIPTPPGAPFAHGTSSPYAPPYTPPWPQTPPPAALPQTGGLGKSSWIVIGVVVVAFVGFILVFMKMNSDHGSDVSRCEEKCKAIRDCGGNADGMSACAAMCGLGPTKTNECIESSGGSCDRLRTCVLGGR